jgi:GTP cyclohydrolase II
MFSRYTIDKIVKRLEGCYVSAKLPIDRGLEARIFGFPHVGGSNAENFALVVPPLSVAPLVRIHSECVTGDILGSLRCDCGQQLFETLELLRHEGGVLIYLRQEGRGIGLLSKIAAYALQENGVDTYTANTMLGHLPDARSYEKATDFLIAAGLTSVRLISNNPAKQSALEAHGIEVVALQNTRVYQTTFNSAYLQAKIDKAAHQLQMNIE